MKLNIDVVGYVLGMCVCVCVWGMLRALIRAWGLLRLMATQLGLDVDANEADFGDDGGGNAEENKADLGKVVDLHNAEDTNTITESRRTHTVEYFGY